MKTLLIAGDRSGSGKTSITLAIAALLSRDRSVQTFKVGMDYIDPSYLTGVTGRPCRNLDSFVMAPQDIRSIFDHGCRGADIALVEGVRGLFEGAEALTDSGSTASIAKALDLPVVLVVSARSITRSAAAIVKGFSAFDPGVKIRGVILNNVSGKQHIDKAVTAVEHYCKIPVIGAIPRHPEMELTMRHLGLVPYLEGTGRGEFDRRIEDVVGFIGQHLSIEKLLSCAGDYVPPELPVLPESAVHSRTPRIAIALDEAFNFYYADLFDTIRGLGAEFITFSPVHDRLPDADGYHNRRGIPGTLPGRAGEERSDAGGGPGDLAEWHPCLRGMRGADVPDGCDHPRARMAGQGDGETVRYVRGIFRGDPHACPAGGHLCRGEQPCGLPGRGILVPGA